MTGSQYGTIVTAIADLRTEMHAGITDLRTEMRAGITDLQTEMRSGFVKITTRLDRLDSDITALHIAHLNHTHATSKPR